MMILEVTYINNASTKKRKVSLDGLMEVTSKSIVLMTLDKKYVKKFAAQQLKETLGVGDSVELGDFEITVDAIRAGSTSDAKDGGQAEHSKKNENENENVNVNVNPVTSIGIMTNKQSGYKLAQPFSSKAGSIPSGGSYSTKRVDNMNGNRNQFAYLQSSSSLSKTSSLVPPGLFIPSNLRRKLRPHQISGVNFILRALTGHSFQSDINAGFRMVLGKGDEMVISEEKEHIGQRNEGSVTARASVLAQEEDMATARGISVSQVNGVEMRYYDDASKYEDSSSHVSNKRSKTSKKATTIDSDSDGDCDDEEAQSDTKRAKGAKAAATAGMDFLDDMSADHKTSKALLSVGEGEDEDEEENDADDDFYGAVSAPLSGFDRVDSRLFSSSPKSHKRKADSVPISPKAMQAQSGPITRGVVLADEMGLGKTYMALTVLAACIAPAIPPPNSITHVRKAIIVVPSSLVDNWQKEIQKLFSVSMRALTIKKSSKQNTEAIKAFAINKIPVLIIGYEMFRTVSNQISGNIKYLELMICDEGHRLKNEKGNQTSSALNKCPAKKRLLLTGTPIQNNLDELYSIVSFVYPGYLGSIHSFRDTYANPIKQCQVKNATVDDMYYGEAACRRLRKKLRNIVIRRTQDQVLKHILPPRTDFLVSLPLGQEQQKMYRQIVDRMVESVGHNNKGSDDDDTPKPQVLASLTKLRLLVSLAPQQVGTLQEPEPKEVEEEVTVVVKEKESEKECVTNMSSVDAVLEGDVSVPKPAKKKGFVVPLATHPSTSSNGPREVVDFYNTGNTPAAAPVDISVEQLIETSSKFRLLDAFLEHLHRDYPQEKVVIVSNFVSVLDQVERLADFKKYKFLKITGKIKSDERQFLVDRFNRNSDSTFLFLLSSRAGGVGLNLIGGSRLIALDADWNPATDNQATARIWRQGQQRPVFIYRFIVQDSIEDSIMRRQLQKGKLASVIHAEDVDLPDSSTEGVEGEKADDETSDATKVSVLQDEVNELMGSTTNVPPVRNPTELMTLAYPITSGNCLEVNKGEDDTKDDAVSDPVISAMREMHYGEDDTPLVTHVMKL